MPMNPCSDSQLQLAVAGAIVERIATKKKTAVE
jgi:hypothetical protein